MVLSLRRVLTLILLLFFAAECVMSLSGSLSTPGGGPYLTIPHQQEIYPLDLVTEGSETRDDRNDSKATCILAEALVWPTRKSKLVQAETVRYQFGSLLGSVALPRHILFRTFQI